MNAMLRALAFAGALIFASATDAQQIPSGHMLGNSGASAGVSRPDSLTNYLDRAFGVGSNTSIYRGASNWTVYTLSTFARTLLDDVDASTARATLGVTIGTNVQAYDADLAALAGLTSAADKCINWSGSGTASVFDCTSYGRSIVGVANEAALKALVNLEIGTDVQAFHARLADISGITYAQGDILYYNGTNLVKLVKGTNGHFLKIGATIPEWAAVPGGGDMLAANNGADFANIATTRDNLRVASTTVRVASTANVNLANGLENGDSLDGVTLATGDAVLLRIQSTTNQNGVYTVVASGAASRRTGFTTYNSNSGILVSATEGSTYAGKVFLGTSAKGGTIDSTALAFTDLTTPAASDTTPGIVELANSTEADAYTDSTRAVTPLLVARTARTFVPTIADDTVYTIPVGVGTFTGFVFFTSNIANTTLLAAQNNVGTDSSTLIFSQAASGTQLATCTGTTGSDGFASACIDNNNVYIQNRLGGSVQFTITVIGR